uniref:Uncharacterized protein n=1 Tax=Octopus bimaculoides TaxID=37653 RepID=A0A0L8H6M6_OCTBM
MKRKKEGRVLIMNDKERKRGKESDYMIGREREREKIGGERDTYMRGEVLYGREKRIRVRREEKKQMRSAVDEKRIKYEKREKERVKNERVIRETKI